MRYYALSASLVRQRHFPRFRGDLLMPDVAGDVRAGEIRVMNRLPGFVEHLAQLTRDLTLVMLVAAALRVKTPAHFIPFPVVAYPSGFPAGRFIVAG
jgi:hypothetical protein